MKTRTPSPGPFPSPLVFSPAAHTLCHALTVLLELATEGLAVLQAQHGAGQPALRLRVGVLQTVILLLQVPQSVPQLVIRLEVT